MDIEGDGGRTTSLSMVFTFNSGSNTVVLTLSFI